MVPNLKKNTLPVEGSVDSKKLKLMVLNVVLFLFTEPVTEPFVLLHGPVPECLRLVHGKELPVPKGWNSLLPTWEPQVTIARNCRLPEVGTHCSQPGNQRLPLQATAGSHLGTTGYHCKELPVPKGWN